MIDRVITFIYELRALCVMAWLFMVHITIISLYPRHCASINEWIAPLAQMGGLLITLWFINNDLRKFNKKGLISILTNAFSKLSGNVVTKDESVPVSGVQGNTGTGVVAVGDQNSIERRLNSLEMSFEKLTQSHELLRNQVQQNKEDSSNAIEQIHGGLYSLIENIAIGGLHRKIFGIFLAAYGTLINLDIFCLDIFCKFFQ